MDAPERPTSAKTRNHSFGSASPSAVLEADEYEDYDVRPKQFAWQRQSRIIALMAGIAVLAAIGAGTFFALSRDDVSVRKETETKAQPRNSTVVVGISLEELALHSSPDDCWHAILGTVYDLTSYAPGKLLWV